MVQTSLVGYTITCVSREDQPDRFRQHWYSSGRYYPFMCNSHPNWNGKGRLIKGSAQSLGDGRRWNGAWLGNGRMEAQIPIPDTRMKLSTRHPFDSRAGERQSHPDQLCTCGLDVTDCGEDQKGMCQYMVRAVFTFHHLHQHRMQRGGMRCIRLTGEPLISRLIERPTVGALNVL